MRLFPYFTDVKLGVNKAWARPEIAQLVSTHFPDSPREKIWT